MRSRLQFSLFCISFFIATSIFQSCGTSTSTTGPTSEINYYEDPEYPLSMRKDEIEHLPRLSEVPAPDAEAIIYNRGPYTGLMLLDTPDQTAKNLISLLGGKVESTVLMLKKGKVIGILEYTSSFSPEVRTIKRATEYTTLEDKPATRTSVYKNPGGSAKLFRVRIITDQSDDPKHKKLAEVLSFYKRTKHPVVKESWFFEDSKMIQKLEYSLNGKIIAQEINGKEEPVIFDGEYQLMTKNGNLLIRHYLNNIPVGTDIEYYQGGGVRIRHDRENGFYRKYFLNGDVAEEVPVVNGVRQGKMTEWYANGDKRAEYEYVNDKPKGVWQRWYKNGELGKKGFFKNGKEAGPVEFFYEDGNKWKTITYEFKNDESFGHYKSWYKNGQKAEEYDLRNDLKHGPYKKWYTNGQLRIETTYHKDRKHGEFKNWEENGSLYQVVYFFRDSKCNEGKFVLRESQMMDFEEEIKLEIRRMDTLQHIKRYYQNASPSEELTLLQGKKQGTYKSWYSNGEPQTIIEYRYGEKHGRFERWDENGTKEEGYYVRDKKVDPADLANKTQKEIDDLLLMY